jgi:hypothetical protein
MNSPFIKVGPMAADATADAQALALRALLENAIYTVGFVKTAQSAQRPRLRNTRR